MEGKVIRIIKLVVSVVAIVGIAVLAGRAMAQDEFSTIVISSYSPTKVLPAVYGTRSAKIGNPLVASTTMYYGVSEVVPDVVYTSTYTYFTKAIPDAFVTWTSTYQYTTTTLPRKGNWAGSLNGVTITDSGSTWMQLSAGVSTMSVRVIDTRK